MPHHSLLPISGCHVARVTHTQSAFSLLPSSDPYTEVEKTWLDTRPDFAVHQGTRRISQSTGIESSDFGECIHGGKDHRRPPFSRVRGEREREREGQLTKSVARHEMDVKRIGGRRRVHLWQPWPSSSPENVILCGLGQSEGFKPRIDWRRERATGASILAFQSLEDGDFSRCFHH